MVAGLGSNPGPALLVGAVILIGIGILKLSSCGAGYSLAAFGLASILLGGGLWLLGEWIDDLVHALTPAVIVGLVLLGAGWYQLSGAGCSLL